MDENFSTTKGKLCYQDIPSRIWNRHQFEVCVSTALYMYNYMEFQDAFVLKVEHNCSKRKRGKGRDRGGASKEQAIYGCVAVDCLCLVVGYTVEHLCNICQPILC